VRAVLPALAAAAGIATAWFAPLAAVLLTLVALALLGLGSLVWRLLDD
jgi:H+/Cl- antiporter ClcA